MLTATGARQVVLIANPRSGNAVRKPPPGVPQGVAGVAASKLKLADSTGRAVIGVFNDERVVGRSWPADNNQISNLELTY